MPTNVLNNGGFELGLMCYGQYEWGSDPSQPGTGYRFSLSSDAHGGGHALQIACVNQAECGFPAKAAVQATPFHTPHSQSYKVSVYSKCTAGDLAFFYSPSSDKGDFSANFACTGDWAPNDFTFTSSATGDYVAYSLYNAGKNTLLLDDLVITYGDGTVPTHTIKHPGQRPSAATASGFTVDGKPFLPLGFYQVPAEQLTKAKQMGVNAIAWGDPGCANTDADAYADLAYEAGITLVPESSTTARLGAPEVFPAVLQAFGGHLANIAWYLDDEPDLDAWVWQPVTPDALTAAYTQIHAASPLPVGVMLQRSHYDSPALDQPYAPAMDVYLSEPYGSSFDGITHTATVFATMPKKPVWLAEDDSLDPALIVPKAYFGFTSGATGLFYFTWSGLEADGKLDAAAQAITELSSLSDVLNGADAGATVTAPPGISWIARTNGTKTTILAVNPAAADVTGDFTVQGLPAGKSVTVQFESRSVTSAAGAFGDTFAGVSRHVYVIE